MAKSYEAHGLTAYSSRFLCHLSVESEARPGKMRTIWKKWDTTVNVFIITMGQKTRSDKASHNYHMTQLPSVIRSDTVVHPTTLLLMLSSTLFPATSKKKKRKKKEQPASTIK